MISKTYNDLRNLILGMEADVEKVDTKQQKAAGKRVRKDLQQAKKLAQELRLEIMDEIR